MYTGVKKLADDVGSEEKMPCIIHGRQSRPNPEVTNPKITGELPNDSFSGLYNYGV